MCTTISKHDKLFNGSEIPIYFVYMDFLDSDVIQKVVNSEFFSVNTYKSYILKPNSKIIGV